MAGNLHNFNVSGSRFINLSRSYGALSAVRIEKADIKNFKLPSQVMEVRKMTSHITAKAALDELNLENLNKNDGFKLIEQKFQPLLPNVKDLLKESEKDAEIPYFASAAKILAAGLEALPGEPWIEITDGLEPLKVVEIDEVLKYLTSKNRKDSIFNASVGLFGSSILAFGGLIGVGLINGDADLVPPAFIVGGILALIGTVFRVSDDQTDLINDIKETQK